MADEFHNDEGMTVRSNVPCFSCGSYHLVWEFTCHTYPQTRRDGTVGYMHCMPCDSAMEIYCKDCDWEYTYGLNKGNPRSVTNEKFRPGWLKEDMSYGALGIPSFPEDVLIPYWDFAEYEEEED